MRPAGRLWVLTGWRGVGKTALCQQVVEVCRGRGQGVGGLLSPGRFSAGAKTGIWAEDLTSGERRLLASALPGELQGPQLGPWTFDDSVFAWGNQRLALTPAGELLVIDELGPLEFDQQRGWMASFDLLAQARHTLTLIVVRPECLEALARLGAQSGAQSGAQPGRPFQTLEVNAGDDLARLAARILT